MSGRHRRDTNDGYVRWLGAGAVTLGLGAAIATGQGVAAATPGEPSDPTSTSSSSAADTTENPADGEVTDHSIGAEKSAPDPAVSDEQNTDDDGDDDIDAEVENSDEAAHAVEEAEELGTADITRSDESPAAVKKSHDASNPGSPSSPAAPDLPTTLVSRDDAEPQTVDTSTESVEPSSTSTALSKVLPISAVKATTAASDETLTSLSDASPTLVEQRVTLAGMVDDVLAWLGLTQAANGLPVPALPVRTLVDSLWLAIRQTVDYRNYQRPAAQPTTSAPGPDDVINADGDGSTPPVTLDPDILADLLAHDGVTIYLDANGGVDSIDGTFTDQIVMTETDAMQVINDLAPLLGAPEDFARADNITVRRIGGTGTAPGAVPETFYRVSHTINGIAVLGSDVILVTDSAGTVTSLFNNYDTRVDDVDLTPSTTEALFPKLIGEADVDSTLVVFAMDSATPPRLTWQIVVDPTEPAGVQPIPGTTYFVYANGVGAGTVFFEDSHAEDVAMTATDYLGQTRQFEAVPATGVVKFLYFFVVRTYPTYALYDAGRNITTYETAFSFFGLGGPVLPGTAWTRSENGWDSAAVSAHANTAAAYDYYADVLGLNSFDGNGAPIRVSIAYNPSSGISRYFGNSYRNAFWDPGNQVLAFGDGGALLAALDVVAHEYTHAVVSYAVGDGGSVLDYGESGAVNEAYADILGVLVEGKSGPGRWLIGEDSAMGVLRNLANPTSIKTSYGPYRDHYEDRYRETGDEGGEHINSTILSHAAYLMMTDPATSDISDETWAALFLSSLNRLSTDAKFSDVRVALVDTADTFDFTDAQMLAIEEAFDDVGISAGVTALV